VPHAGICAGGPEWTVPTGILSFTVCSGASLKSDTAAKDAEIRVLRHYVESIAEPTRSSCDGATSPIGGGLNKPAWPSSIY